MTEDKVDFLIIGAGAAGAAAAFNLADTGTSILCLEQGDWKKICPIDDPYYNTDPPKY